MSSDTFSAPSRSEAEAGKKTIARACLLTRSLRRRDLRLMLARRAMTETRHWHNQSGSRADTETAAEVQCWTRLRTQSAIVKLALLSVNQIIPLCLSDMFFSMNAKGIKYDTFITTRNCHNVVPQTGAESKSGDAMNNGQSRRGEIFLQQCCDWCERPSLEHDYPKRLRLELVAKRFCDGNAPECD